MSTTTDKILEKVKKLLRLADLKRGATPAEAATAAAKAQALLLEHNLTVESVGDLESGEKPEEVGYEEMQFEATYQTSRWHMQLLHRISTPLFCRSCYFPARPGKPGGASLIGKPSNVAVVKYLYGYLHRTIDGMAVEYREKWKADMQAKGEKVIPDDSTRVRINFCYGAANEVGRRLDEQYTKRTKADDTSRALVVVSDKELDEKFKKMHPNTGKTGCNRQLDLAAQLAGRKAGSKIPLRTGLDGKGGEGQRRLS